MIHYIYDQHYYYIDYNISVVNNREFHCYFTQSIGKLAGQFFYSPLISCNAALTHCGDRAFLSSSNNYLTILNPIFKTFTHENAYDKHNPPADEQKAIQTELSILVSKTNTTSYPNTANTNKNSRWNSTVKRVRKSIF